MKALALVVVAAATFAPLASGDAVYHTEHLALAPQGGAPLRSAFVQNIKANGPVVYAHELFVLNGAQPRTTYRVTRNFYVFDTGCDDEEALFAEPAGTITTNAAGDGRGDVIVRPEEVPSFLVGDHGVRWTVTDVSGSLRYQTACTTVSLD
jgi:hypothetical protein